MMALDYVIYDPSDLQELTDWLCSDSWPFHGAPKLTPEIVERWSEEGFFSAPDARCFWILDSESGRIGFLRLHDLEDPTPLIDIRILSGHRGRGVGKQVIRWLTRHVFEEFPHVHRLEGHTRVDNRAMRRVFRQCGYVKEAHYRRAWPTGGGTLADATAYAVLREDWATGRATPVNFDDE